jgi:hypothetical protein
VRVETEENKSGEATSRRSSGEITHSRELISPRPGEHSLMFHYRFSQPNSNHRNPRVLPLFTQHYCERRADIASCACVQAMGKSSDPIQCLQTAFSLTQAVVSSGRSPQKPRSRFFILLLSTQKARKCFSRNKKRENC